MSAWTNDEISHAACDLTHKLADLFEGTPTAAVYIALSYTLGRMEASAKRPDREGTFRILSNGMDAQIAILRGTAAPSPSTPAATEGKK